MLSSSKETIYIYFDSSQSISPDSCLVKKTIFQICEQFLSLRDLPIAPFENDCVALVLCRGKIPKEKTMTVNYNLQASYEFETSREKLSCSLDTSPRFSLSTDERGKERRDIV